MPLLAENSYPLLEVFWTMVLFFLWVSWFWILISVISDLFSRHDIGGGSKALWTLFVIVVPFLGVFLYLVAQGKQMAERRVDRARESEAAFGDYVRKVSSDSGGGGAAGEIAKAKELLDSGAINSDEYERLKARAIA
jgi:hypothetical protein